MSAKAQEAASDLANGHFKRGLYAAAIDLLKVWGPLAAVCAYFLYADYLDRQADLADRVQRQNQASVLTDALVQDVDLRRAAELATRESMESGFETLTAATRSVQIEMQNAGDLMSEVPAMRKRELDLAQQSLKLNEEIRDSLKPFSDVPDVHKQQCEVLSEILKHAKQ